jgi:hopanoid biosynthesis associated radical SAM protein HpnJ
VRKTLLLNPPSFEGFDGGAGARYQARREVRSFWYPTWLAQPAALIPGSRLIDAPPEGLTVEDVLARAAGYDLCVIHTSTPSLRNDARVAEALKAAYPRLRIGFVGAHAAVRPVETLQASPAIDFAARHEFDYTLREVAEGRDDADIDGISYRENGRIVHNRDRALIQDMDLLPSVVDVYKRDLTPAHYFIGYLRHPYLSLYTGRGCPAKCSFCLWPQTIGGHQYRARSPESVAHELARARALFPQVKEFFFDDDTFTADLPRAEAIARRLKTLGITWSCNARPTVPRGTLEVLKDCGLRLLLVGYESGNQQILNNIKKGTRLEGMRRFSKDCQDLGIRIHGTFILGLPGETRETVQETIRFACEIEPDTLQVSLAAAYPGTELHAQAMANGWFAEESLVNASGIQVASLEYPGLARSEIFHSVEAFYRRFYFRPRKVFSILGTMARDGKVCRRRLREGWEFLRFMARRKQGAAAA